MKKRFGKVTTSLFSLALVFLCGSFGFNILAQNDKPLDAKSLAALVGDLKEVVAKSGAEEKDAATVAKNWDVRKDLTGKTRKVVIDLLYQDVKANIKDSGVLYQIFSIFAAIADDDKFQTQSGGKLNCLNLGGPSLCRH
jgi:hypothetical protein